MYATIVVGTDGSRTAAAAVDHAADLAAACGGRVHVVTAYRSLESLTLAPEAMVVDLGGLVDPEADATKVAEEAAGRVRTKAGGDVEVHAVASDAASALLDVADNVGADVIVVGSRGMTSAAKVLLGNVPNKVSHHAGCDVLIVATA